MSFEVREAVPADLPHVLGLLLDAGLPLVGVPHSLERFVVAVEETVLIGAAGLEPYGSAALLRSVVVSSDARGSGVGRRLIERVVDSADRSGITDLFLLTTTAREYFPRFGFVVAAREELPDEMLASAEFNGACPDTAVLMRRR